MSDEKQLEFLRFVAEKIVESIRRNFQGKFGRGLPEEGIKLVPTQDGQAFQVFVDETIFMHNRGGHANPHQYTDEHVKYLEAELHNFGITNIQVMEGEKGKLSPEMQIPANRAIYSAVRETPVDIGRSVLAKADELGIVLQLTKVPARKPLAPGQVGRLGGMALGLSTATPTG